MILYIFSVIITFLFFIWLFKVPCVIYDDKSGSYKPIGLKIWFLLFVLILSLTPIVNVVLIAAAILILFIMSYLEDIEMTDMFPNGKMNKLITFLNKKL